jgi:SAM-dependent MidA family methyltransferase
MPYDPDARRETPLALDLKARIRRDGPITVHDYMYACLQDPTHGYYRTKTAIGRSGDFITAPEISQIFGELIGLWSVVVWQQLGSPPHLRLIELGPGRGTLMLDALRAAARAPAFTAAIEVVLVESSATLADQQRHTLSDVTVPLRWVAETGDLPMGAPSIVIANEFLDALPVRQIVLDGLEPRERVVTLDAGGRLIFDNAGPLALAPSIPVSVRASARPGAIFEMCNWAAPLDPIARLLVTAPAAVLFIDYGHTTHSAGETLQALRAHAYEHPLTSPGEADLTTHVDFEAVSSCFRDASNIAGPTTQAEFLGSLGIAERASRLMAANPTKAAEIEAGVMRLMSPGGMGSRFKVLGLSSKGFPQLPGLPPVDRRD